MAPRQRNAGGLASLVTRRMSCGVIVTDGRLLLIGHATASPRWDIPKGAAEPGEAPEAAARRELLEETGLTAPAQALRSLGRFDYLPGKDLELFVWQVAQMPDAAKLDCSSTFTRAGRELPEFDQFALVAWAEALPKFGKSMAIVLAGVARAEGWIAEA